MGTENWTPSEMMVIRASEELMDGEVVFVGIGLPNLACNLARATHAPQLFQIYESGAVGTVPERVPVSIGDPALVTNCVSVVGQGDIFQSYLQRGLIEVGFLGGAQIDRFGNINTTVIGSYASPTVRLPGSGGACEIAIHSKRVLIVMKMSPKSFVDKCDFVTSPGQWFQSKMASSQPNKSRAELGLPGRGPTKVITDLGVCEFRDNEMELVEMYPGVTQDAVRKACGWPLKMAKELATTPSPSEPILRLLREKLDPQKLYL